MSHANSLIIVCPVPHLSAANALAAQLGWGENELSIPLSPTGAEPATAYALHAWSRDSTVALFQGQIVPEGVDAEQLATVLAGLTVSARVSGNAVEHFQDVLTASSLARIEIAL